jgi:hypothetical protein
VLARDKIPTRVLRSRASYMFQATVCEEWNRALKVIDPEIRGRMSLSIESDAEERASAKHCLPDSCRHSLSRAIDRDAGILAPWSPSFSPKGVAATISIPDPYESRCVPTKASMAKRR